MQKKQHISFGRTVNEEEKRKPHTEKIRHIRALTPQEQQSIDTLEMEITKLNIDYQSGRITESARNSARNSFRSQISWIKGRAEWY